MSTLKMKALQPLMRKVMEELIAFNKLLGLRVESFDRESHPIGEHACEIEIDPGENQQELFTAPPDQDVIGPHCPPEQRADVPQQLVAGLVPERVVDLLEAIDIQEDAAQRTLFSLCARNFVGDVFLAAPPVGKSS